MNIILLDLEWNQPFPNQRLKKQGNVSLLYEVIQIGAVLMSEDGRILSNFSAQVCARQYKKINPFVAKVTKLSTKDIQQGCTLTEAMQAFYLWANLPETADSTFLATWSESDLPILKNNLDFYRIANHLPQQYFDLQAVYACIALGKRKSLSVEKALESLEIAVEKPLHQAWVDAEYSAQIYAVLATYAGSLMPKILADFVYDHRVPRTMKQPLPIKKSRKSLLQMFRQKKYTCPSCGEVLQKPGPKVAAEVEADAAVAVKGCNNVKNETVQNQNKSASVREGKKRKFFAYQQTLLCPLHGEIEVKLSMKHDLSEEFYQGQVHLKRSLPGANSWNLLPPLAPEISEAETSEAGFATKPV